MSGLFTYRDTVDGGVFVAVNGRALGVARDVGGGVWQGRLLPMVDGGRRGGFPWPGPRFGSVREVAVWLAEEDGRLVRGLAGVR